MIHGGGYPYPITFSSLGIWGAAIVGQTLVRSGLYKDIKPMSSDKWVRTILPVAVVSGTSLATGNVVYAYLSISFAQMLKALTPVYILLVLGVFGLKVPQRKSVYAVLIITAGTALASLGELKFSMIGFWLQTLADLLEGIRLVLIQTLMSEHKLTPFETIYFLFPAVSVFQVFLSLCFEPQALTTGAAWAVVAKQWYMFVFGIVLGFIINFGSSQVIKHTSGLTFKLIGIMRNNGLVLFAVTFLGEQTTLVQIIGYVVSIAGFTWYTHIEQQMANVPTYVKLEPPCSDDKELKEHESEESKI